jgi:hypothetical protein
MPGNSAQELLFEISCPAARYKLFAHRSPPNIVVHYDGADSPPEGFSPSGIGKAALKRNRPWRSKYIPRKLYLRG